jgi:hypothetical protein
MFQTKIVEKLETHILCVCVCVCVCMYLCMYVCIYMCVCMYIYNVFSKIVMFMR